MRDIYYVAYGCGSVLFQQGDEIASGRAILGVYFLIICPIAIAYSMGQIIKSFCVCACVCKFTKLDTDV